MLFFKQAAFYKSVQGAFTYDVMASEWEWGRQNTLFKERVYFLIWFIINVLYRILIAYHLLCLSRYLSSYLIANAHNDFAENFHFSNSSLSTVAPSIVLYPAELENRYKLSVGKVFSFSLYLHYALK